MYKKTKKIVNKIGKGLREEIISLIDSGTMKNFMTGIQEELLVCDFVEIITKAPVFIERKIDLLEQLGNENADVNYSVVISGCIGAAKDAIRRLKEIDHSKSCLQLLCIDTDRKMTFEPYISDAVPIFDYQHAIQYIREEVFCGEEAEYPKRHEFFFKIVLYDMEESGKMKEYMEYICDSEGQIQYLGDFGGISAMEEAGQGKNYIKYFNGHGAEYWAVPFTAGDILYIDCRPYFPPAYCVVSYVSQSMPADCCGLRCLYPTYSGIIAEGAIKHGHFLPMGDSYYSDCCLSPLFRAEIYEGELPKEYDFLVEISRRIKEEPDLSEKIEVLLANYMKEYVLVPAFVPHSVKDENCRSIYGLCREDFDKMLTEASQISVVSF